MAGRFSRASAGAGLALLIGLAGCSGDEQVISTDGGTVTVNEDDNRIEIETGEGTAVISGEGSGELPDGWPSVVVLPDGGSIVNSVSLDSQGVQQQGWSVTVDYGSADVEGLLDTFDSSLQGAGFERDARFATEDGGGSTFTSAEYFVSLIATSEEGQVTAVVTVGTADQG